MAMKKLMKKEKYCRDATHLKKKGGEEREKRDEM